jgi:hypothetical protein
MLGSCRVHEGGHDPTSVAVGFKLANGGHEVAVQGVDKGRSNSNNTRTLNESNSVTNVMQQTHTYIENSNEKPVQSVLKDVTKGDDLNFFFSSDFDDEIECCSSNNSNTVSIRNDRSSVNQNFGNTDPEKQPCSTSDLVSGVINTARIPVPSLGENVWEHADFAVEEWSKGQLKGSNGKVMQVKSWQLIYFVSLLFCDCMCLGNAMLCCRKLTSNTTVYKEVVSS